MAVKMSEVRRKRVRAARMPLADKRMAEVATAVGIARQTVYTWNRVHDEEDSDVVRTIPDAGRPGQLDAGDFKWPDTALRICNAAVMQPSGLNFYIKNSDAEVAPLVPWNISRNVENQFEGVFTMSIRKSIIALSLVLPALSVFALDQGDIAKSVQLKDGSTVHQFKDGKMAMEDKYGRTVRMKGGVTMETIDGRSVTMNGDEVAKLDQLLKAPKY